MLEHEVPIGGHYKIFPAEDNPWSYIRISETEVMRTEIMGEESFPHHFIGEIISKIRELKVILIDLVPISLDSIIRGMNHVK